MKDNEDYIDWAIFIFVILIMIFLSVLFYIIIPLQLYHAWGVLGVIVYFLVLALLS